MPPICEKIVTCQSADNNHNNNAPVMLASSIVSKPGNHVKIASPETIAETCQKYLSTPWQVIESTESPSNLEIIRSSSDKFDYKLLRLSNGIRMLLVSDPEYRALGAQDDEQEDDTEERSASKSSGRVESMSTDGEDAADDDEDASEDFHGSFDEDDDGGESGSKEKTSAIVVAVKAGSFQDPPEFPGMAHMLEHLLSMGSRAYPQENYIDDFLNSRGGDQNAFTECEYTCYTIRVQRPFLKQTMELIAKTFEAPLLRQSSIDREIEPIDSEFTEASCDDSNRAELLLSHLSNSDSSFHRFLWGNTNSLINEPKKAGLDTREAVLEWYAKHYRPEDMVVVVQSLEPMENLEEWARMFENIRPDPTSSGAVTLSRDPRLPFEENEKFHKLYYVESAEAGTKLVISWTFPPLVQDYLRSSLDFVGTLLGYEGRGSLLSEYKRQNLAASLATNSEHFTSKVNHRYSIFQIELELTEKGADRLDEVVALLSEYLSVMQRTGTQKYFFDENQLIALQSFNWSSEIEALDNAERLARHVLFFPIEHILVGRSVYYHYDPKAIDDMMATFTVENANFMMIGSKLLTPDRATHEEPWAKTKYQVVDIPRQWTEQMFNGKSERFFYPLSNRFIASNFDLLNDVLPDDAEERAWSTKPQIILKNDSFTVWYKPDFEFNLPKGKVYFHLMSPAIEGNTRDETICDVFCEMLLFELNEHCYDADLAQLSFAMARTFNGIQLPVAGFNHKLSELIFLIFERILNIEVCEQRLSTIKKELVKNYNNRYYDQDAFGRHLRLKMLMKHYSTYLDRAKIIDGITKTDVEQFKHRLLDTLSVEMLIQGNISLKEAHSLASQLSQLLRLEEKNLDLKYPQINFPITKLEAGLKKKVCRLNMNPKSEMNHVVCYFQLAEYNFKDYTYLALFIDIIHELCFNHLRTIEGLGYSVGCDLNDTFGILGFNVYVTSPGQKFDCCHTESLIEDFVFETCKKQFAKLSDEKYEEHIQSLINRKKEKDVALDEEMARNMGEITAFNYFFQRLATEVQCLELIKGHKSEFIAWLGKNVWDRQAARQLTIEIAGNHEKTLENLITSTGCPVEPRSENHDSSTELCLRSKTDEPSTTYIFDIHGFKKSQEFFPPQPPTKDLVIEL